MDIRDIDWGNDSAESDHNLLEYYIDLPIQRFLINKRKNIVVGRKGAGKSAVRKKLINSFKNAINIEIMPTESIIKSISSEEKLSKLDNSEILFQHVWLAYIYDCIFEKLANSFSGKAASGSKEFIIDYVKNQDKYTSDLLGILTKAISTLKIEAGKLGNFGVNIENKIKEAVNSEVMEYHLSQVLNNEEIVIYIDDLDLGWDNSEVSNYLLLGLLNTINYLSKFKKWIHVFVFLRSDMYKILMSKTQHSDKFRDVAYIKWDKVSLRKLITERIDFNLRENEQEFKGDSFNFVFPNKIGKIFTIDWMIDRTLNRPRELLLMSKFYSESLIENNPDDNKLHEIEKLYSDMKLEDVCNEYMNEYPMLRTFFESWKVINYRINYHFKYDEFKHYIKNVIDNKLFDVDWIILDDGTPNYSKIMNVLYEIGFIGDFIRGGEGGSKTIFSVIDDTHEPSFEEVQIHTCFRVGVGTKKRNR